MGKNLARMDFSYIREMLTKARPGVSENLLLTRDWAVVSGNAYALFSFFRQMETPFLINDYRMAVVVRGSGRVMLNLMEHTLEAGMLVFLCPGTVAQPLQIDADLELRGMALFHDLPLYFAGSSVPQLFTGGARACVLRTDSDEETQLLQDMFTLLHRLGSRQPPVATVFRTQAAAIMQLISHVYERTKAQESGRQGRQQQVLALFASLVAKHARHERHLHFYADQLCLTPRHLGTVVREVSGKTAKEWIDHAVLAEAKVMLRHSQLPIAEVAEQLHFPETSFFCRFFKRMTGMTPTEWRREKT